MLVSKYGLKIDDIDADLDALKKQNQGASKILKAQIALLRDYRAGQTHLVAMGTFQDGVTVESTEKALRSINDTYSERKRHLNALKRCVEDEIKATADAQQAKLPIEIPAEPMDDECTAGRPDNSTDVPFDSEEVVADKYAEASSNFQRNPMSTKKENATSGSLPLKWH